MKKPLHSDKSAGADFLHYRKFLPIKQKDYMSRRTESKLSSAMDESKTVAVGVRRSRFLVVI